MEQTTFKDGSVQEALKQFVFVSLNIDEAKSLSYEFKIKSVPWIVAIDPARRQKVNELVGFADAQKFLGFLKESSEKLAAAGKQEENNLTFEFMYKQSGFSIESSDKSIILDFWTYHLIEAFDFEKSGAVSDTFRLRHSLFGIQATLEEKWTLASVFDFAADKPLQDLYAEYQFTRPINLRTGKFKVPMGITFLPRRDFLDFVEPS